MRRITLVIGSILTGWVLGPPLSGAIIALFWQTNFHSDPKWDAAEAILTTTGFSSRRWQSPRTISPDDCGFHLPAKNLSWKGASDGEENFLIAVDVLYESRVNAEFKLLGIDSLYELPAPALGALHSCVFGSPASIFCESYVSRRVEHAISLSPAAQQKIFADADAQRQSALCVVDPAD